VRAAAVTSLGAIDHDSVFAPVLGALADDSREVRAAAARAFSGLNFDRADAAVRVIETADAETLRALAAACVKSGLAAQAVSRLASEDRRQAYEAFSLLSLILHGGETSPIVEAVASHRDESVRLAAVRVAVLSGRRELLGALRDVAAQENLPRAVREAIAGACEQDEAGARL
jgi:HEAT repeat protein